MRDARAGIEEFFRQRYGREALYLPSGRVALYLAFREWLQPGDRLLMSPVTDDVVLFIALAARLVPVLGPLDPSTGNLDPSAVDETTWAGLQAVLTTNLYGIPDRMDLLQDRCDRHGVLLIEDACHALDSSFAGKRIGTYGPVAAFSMAKHLKGVGGVLTFADARRRPQLTERAKKDTRSHTLPETLRIEAESLAKTLAEITGTKNHIRRIRDFLVPRPAERDGHRLIYDAGEVLRAGREGGGLERFDRWTRIDNHAYRAYPPTRQVEKTLQRLESFPHERERWIEGARKLRGLDLDSPAVLDSVDFALFKFPLFVRDRETVAPYFTGRGVRVDYIYDPPLDIFVPRELADRVASPPAALAWSRDIFPVEPLQADAFIRLLQGSPALRPACPTA